MGHVPRWRTRATAALVLLVMGVVAASPSGQGEQAPDLDWFYKATSRDDREAAEALRQIAAAWKDGYAAMIVDMARLMRPSRRPAAESELQQDAQADPEDARTTNPDSPARTPSPTPALQHPSSLIRARLIRFLERQTGQRFGDDLHRWREWMWRLPYDPHPQYAAFKGRVYAQIDPGFAAFFTNTPQTTIRLDEVDWGGVSVNGIPPLVQPPHIPAAEARYLKDDHVVFGVVWEGVARAYPKRILAWHEMALDRLGSLDLTLVYCTLCGTVIPYDSRAGGKTFKFGTSGLLYRSNKLMFDAETKSLWSSLDGTPVIGPLVGSGLRLTMFPVVTTTWGEWKTQHPETTVLSLETGFSRNYAEGAAYREYFATDELMFRVPQVDRRLKNKAEVVVFRVPLSDGMIQPVAIATSLLRRERVYHLDVANQRFVVLTSARGANRVYRAGSRRFTTGATADQLIDDQGVAWTADEERLRPLNAPGELSRVPAARAFWFGWYAQYPHTLLVQ